MRAWKFKSTLPMRIYGDLRVKQRLGKLFEYEWRWRKLMCDNKFTECDEFLSVNDVFLWGFIIVNLHICFVTSSDICGNFVIFSVRCRSFWVSFVCNFLCCVSTLNKHLWINSIKSSFSPFSHSMIIMTKRKAWIPNWINR